MTALYFIASMYREDAAKLADLELDEQTMLDTLEGLGAELEVKAENVAFVIRSIEADAAAITQWAKDAQERARTVQARADRLRQYLSTQLQACGIQKVSGSGIELSFRKSSSVVIDEPGLLPYEYTRQPPTPPAMPDKIAIAAAIKVGQVVPGAHVEQHTNLVIR